MKVMMLASEGVPFIKTGGLADVIGSLPKALKDKGIDVAVVMPKYQDIPPHYREQMTHLKSIDVTLGWRKQFCGIEVLDYNGIPFYFIDNQYYFHREGLYGHYDDAERFAFFGKAVLDILPHIDFKPDILHCHDWHTGIVPLFLKTHYVNDDFYRDLRSIFTIHNLQYQGIFPRDILGDILGLDDSVFTVDKIEFFGQVNYMKAGLVFSDLLTTVSHTYAEEIQYPYFGENLDSLLRHRKNDLHGIINGIDYQLYNPSIDPYIDVNYHWSLKKKQENKVKLQEQLGLPMNDKSPMIAMVTRLVRAKGLDLVMRVLEDILAQDVQLVILGTGDKHYETALLDAYQRHRGKVSVNIMFDTGLSHKIYAGSDMFLMPSQYEPCGIGQLIALRYGSIPIVRETGGLRDTVKAYNESNGEGNGFTFANFNAHDMLHTIERALQFYHDENHWRKIVMNATRGDFSWEQSAQQYIQLYQGLF
ncbi:MAG: glycogen synthase GlgA [Bacillota bacterium]